MHINTFIILLFHPTRPATGWCFHCENCDNKAEIYAKKTIIETTE